MLHKSWEISINSESSFPIHVFDLDSVIFFLYLTENKQITSVQHLFLPHSS